MEIIDYTYTNQRNNFTAIYRCEHCGYKVPAWGYNDDYFHNTVVPNVHCESCGKKSNGQMLQPGEKKS